LLRWRYSPLTQILLEADSLDDLNDDRLKVQMSNTKNPVLKIGMWLGNMMEVVALKLLVKSSYSKNKLKGI
jgi:hypothetical protein